MALTNSINSLDPEIQPPRCATPPNPPFIFMSLALLFSSVQSFELRGPCYRFHGGKLDWSCDPTLFSRPLCLGQGLTCRVHLSPWLEQSMDTTAPSLVHNKSSSPLNNPHVSSNPVDSILHNRQVGVPRRYASLHMVSAMVGGMLRCSLVHPTCNETH